MNENVHKLSTKLIAEQIGMLIIGAKTAEAEIHFLMQENQILRQQLQEASENKSAAEI